MAKPSVGHALTKTDDGVSTRLVSGVPVIAGVRTKRRHEARRSPEPNGYTSAVAPGGERVGGGR